MSRSRSRMKSLKDKVQRLKADRIKTLDELRFLRGWVVNPLKTGAVAPSGPDLARKMASFVEVGPHVKVLELGPGTGVMTKALLDRGLGQKNITAIEYNPTFCRLLQSRYPGLKMINGDAYALARTLCLDPSSPLEFDAIVSSLPLLTRPEPHREALLTEAFGVLKPGGPFIQFSYGLRPPVRPAGAAIVAVPSKWVWKNLPPARVWVYRATQPH
ncbi:MAG: methyltransferase domain-containing protein [Roseibium sp.]|nr:methyltransferase domain-containing protein [Roseibium sp.]